MSVCQVCDSPCGGDVCPDCDASIKRGQADIAAGRIVSWEQVKRGNDLTGTYEGITAKEMKQAEIYHRQYEADAALGRALRDMAEGKLTISGDVLGGTWDDLAYVAGAKKILTRLWGQTPTGTPAEPTDAHDNPDPDEGAK